MQKYQRNQAVKLCFRTHTGEYVQHSMDLVTALYVARDIQAAYPSAEVFAVDKYGRHIDGRPLTFADVEY